MEGLSDGLLLLLDNKEVVEEKRVIDARLLLRVACMLITFHLCLLSQVGLLLDHLTGDLRSCCALALALLDRA